MTKNPAAAITLSCGQPHAEDELRRAVASLANARRVTKSGGRNGGRPKVADRCPCGRYSVKLAAKRGHRCERPAESQGMATSSPQNPL